MTAHGDSVQGKQVNTSHFVPTTPHPPVFVKEEVMIEWKSDKYT